MGWLHPSPLLSLTQSPITPVLTHSSLLAGYIYYLSAFRYCLEAAAAAASQPESPVLESQQSFGYASLKWVKFMIVYVAFYWLFVIIVITGWTHTIEANVSCITLGEEGGRAQSNSFPMEVTWFWRLKHDSSMFLAWETCLSHASVFKTMWPP